MLTSKPIAVLQLPEGFTENLWYLPVVRNAARPSESALTNEPNAMASPRRFLEATATDPLPWSISGLVIFAIDTLSANSESPVFRVADIDCPVKVTILDPWTPTTLALPPSQTIESMLDGRVSSVPNASKFSKVNDGVADCPIYEMFASARDQFLVVKLYIKRLSTAPVPKVTLGYAQMIKLRIGSKVADIREINPSSRFWKKYLSTFSAPIGIIS